MIQQALRLNGVEEYYFSKKLMQVRGMREAGTPVINLGIGSPDLPPPPEVLSALNQALLAPDAHQYQPYRGVTDFRVAIQEFYRNYYDVALDPATEILPLMGSKEGITHISMAFLNQGDEVLIPNPGYPTYAAVSRLLGAVPLSYELEEDRDWLPDLEQLEQRDLSKVKLMWVNYPHMPTGAMGSARLFRKLVSFAKKHKILLVNDNPYSLILNEQVESILKQEGAKEVVLELNSLSKSFNMSGWRVGMLCGSQANINAVLKVKTNMDSGMFFPLQVGAAQALRLSRDWFEGQNKVYAARKEHMLHLARALGCEPAMRQAGMFLWCRLPGAESSECFVDQLLHQAHIFAAPGSIFGSRGEGYIRFSLCAPEEHIEEALQRVQK